VEVSFLPGAVKECRRHCIVRRATLVPAIETQTIGLDPLDVGQGDGRTGRIGDPVVEPSKIVPRLRREDDGPAPELTSLSRAAWRERTAAKTVSAGWPRAGSARIAS
jgi:hypothetical protein